MLINFSHLSIIWLCILIYNIRNDLSKKLLIHTKIFEVQGRSDLGEKNLIQIFIWYASEI